MILLNFLLNFKSVVDFPVEVGPQNLKKFKSSLNNSVFKKEFNIFLF